MKFDDPMRFLMQKVDLPHIDASQGPLLAHASPASSSHNGGCRCTIKGAVWIGKGLVVGCEAFGNSKLSFMDVWPKKMLYARIWNHPN